VQLWQKKAAGTQAAGRACPGLLTWSSRITGTTAGPASRTTLCCCQAIGICCGHATIFRGEAIPSTTVITADSVCLQKIDAFEPLLAY